MEPISRRNMLVTSGLAFGAVAASLGNAQADEAPGHQPKVVVAGGHPGDPEAACGGTMARMVDLGHEVIALYVTRGERGIRGKSQIEAGAIRTEEAKKACELLKARALFAGQVDGSTELTPAHYDEFRSSWKPKSHRWFLHTGPSTLTETIGPLRCWCTTLGWHAAGSSPCITMRSQRGRRLNSFGRHITSTLQVRKHESVRLVLPMRVKIPRSFMPTTRKCIVSVGSRAAVRRPKLSCITTKAPWNDCPADRLIGAPG
jgi:hypothetical protein